MKSAWRAATGVTLATVFGAFVLANAPSRGAGSPQFVAALTALLDGPSGNAIASVQPGAAVDVAEQSGSATHITIHGWTTPKAAGTLYSAPDKHIIELTGLKATGTPGSAQTVAGTTYTAVSVDGWIASSAVVADVQPVWTTAASLYQQKCSTCHSVPAVDSNGSDDWPGVVQTWAPSANLDAAQTALLTAYLQTQSAH